MQELNRGGKWLYSHSNPLPPLTTWAHHSRYQKKIGCKVFFMLLCLSRVFYFYVIRDHYGPPGAPKRTHFGPERLFWGPRRSLGSPGGSDLGPTATGWSNWVGHMAMMLNELTWTYWASLSAAVILYSQVEFIKNYHLAIHWLSLWFRSTRSIWSVLSAQEPSLLFRSFIGTKELMPGARVFIDCHYHCYCHCHCDIRYDLIGRASEKHSSPSLFSPSHPPRFVNWIINWESFAWNSFLIMTTPSDMLVHTVAKSSPSKTRSRNTFPR